MATDVFSAPHFNNEDAARQHLEAIRWPDGPVCPHCGSINRAYATKRPGKYRCAEKECRKDFTATVGTVFERSHIPLTMWFKAIHLLCSSKKGISSHQLHRTLNVTYKTAWFMVHRIREAMRAGKLALAGGNGGTVEVDETFIGREPGMPKRRGYAHKMKVLSLIDRERRKVRSIVIDDLTAATIMPILRENIAKETFVMTDDAGQYENVCEDFEAHGAVRHSQGEYVVGEDFHTNTLEGYFSVFKRGMKGIYQHCSKHHLHRYIAEFDFRYNHRVALGIHDEERTVKAIKGAEGKRLKYGGSPKKETHIAH